MPNIVFTRLLHCSADNSGEGVSEQALVRITDDVAAEIRRMSQICRAAGLFAVESERKRLGQPAMVDALYDEAVGKFNEAVSRGDLAADAWASRIAEAGAGNGLDTCRLVVDGRQFWYRYSAAHTGEQIETDRVDIADLPVPQVSLADQAAPAGQPQLSYEELLADRNRLLELLAIATTALRDVEMGYQPREVYTGDLDTDEPGLAGALRGLVRELRGRGIDDEGGWDTSVTEDIPVAGAQQGDANEADDAPTL